MADHTGRIEAGCYLIQTKTKIPHRIVNAHVVGRTQGDYRYSQDGAMSSKHFKVTVDDTQVYIEELGSRNGTKVNGVSLIQGKKMRLNFGDQIEAGHQIFILSPTAQTQDIAKVQIQFSQSASMRASSQPRSSHAVAVMNNRSKYLMPEEPVSHSRSWVRMLGLVLTLFGCAYYAYTSGALDAYLKGQDRSPASQVQSSGQ